MDTRRGTLVIACGALAREIAALRRANAWTALDVRCLPAELHNRPERIAAAVRAEIARAARALSHRSSWPTATAAPAASSMPCSRRKASNAFPGAHCYEFFATARGIRASSAEAEPGTFYLTDFLLRHFERLVIRPLGLDRHPELLPITSATTASSSTWRRRGSPAPRARARDRARMGLASSIASPATASSARACAAWREPRIPLAWQA